MKKSQQQGTQLGVLLMFALAFPSAVGSFQLLSRSEFFFHFQDSFDQLTLIRTGAEAIIYSVAAVSAWYILQGSKKAYYAGMVSMGIVVLFQLFTYMQFQTWGLYPLLMALVSMISIGSQQNDVKS